MKLAFKEVVTCAVPYGGKIIVFTQLGNIYEMKVDNKPVNPKYVLTKIEDVSVNDN